MQSENTRIKTNLRIFQRKQEEMNDFITVNRKKNRRNTKASKIKASYLANSSTSSCSDDEIWLSSKVKILIDGQLREGHKYVPFNVNCKYLMDFYAENTKFEGPDGKVLSAPVFLF